jgi:hypothetical protein
VCCLPAEDPGDHSLHAYLPYNGIIRIAYGDWEELQLRRALTGVDGSHGRSVRVNVSDISAAL